MEKHGGRFSFYTRVASKLASSNVLVQHEHKNMHLPCTLSTLKKKNINIILVNKSEITAEILLMVVKCCFPLR